MHSKNVMGEGGKVDLVKSRFLIMIANKKEYNKHICYSVQLEFGLDACT